MSEGARADRCPLCGEANACALAGDPAQPVDACWCVSREFPASLRARAPDASACICQACLERETSTGADSGKGSEG